MVLPLKVRRQKFIDLKVKSKVGAVADIKISYQYKLSEGGEIKYKKVNLG